MTNIVSLLWAYNNLDSPVVEDRAVANLIVLKYNASQHNVGKVISVEQARDIFCSLLGDYDSEQEES